MWRVARRGLEYPCKHGALIQSKVGCVYSKIALGCRLDTVIPAAEVNVIQVHLKDILLAVLPLHLIGKGCLLSLSGYGFFGGEVAELYELLAYGRGSLNVAAGLYIRHDSAGDAYDVYSLVFKKSRVFGGDKSIHSAWL